MSTRHFPWPAALIALFLFVFSMKSASVWAQQSATQSAVQSDAVQPGVVQPDAAQLESDPQADANSTPRLERIDYRHQDISLTRVPKILRDAVRESMSESDLSDFLKDIRVELKVANSSSIDYWIFVTCDSRAAKSYNRIDRIIQSSCIEACNKQSLDIPFPHVAIVQKSS